MFLAGRKAVRAGGAEVHAARGRGSPHAASITRGPGTPRCLRPGRARRLGVSEQLSCPGSITLPDVRQEDLYVF